MFDEKTRVQKSHETVPLNKSLHILDLTCAIFLVERVTCYNNNFWAEHCYEYIHISDTHSRPEWESISLMSSWC